jgi:hypothetical protein
VAWVDDELASVSAKIRITIREKPDDTCWRRLDKRIERFGTFVELSVPTLGDRSASRFLHWLQ